MPLEDLTGSKYITNLNANNPTGIDPKSKGDDHLRGIKNVLLKSFPAISGPVSVTHTDLNDVPAIRSAANAADARSTQNAADIATINASTAAMAGQIVVFAMSTAPTGFLECNGAEISRTAFANLYAAIGTTYGAGDGTSTFYIPDLRGEFIRGFDNGRGVDSGRAIGSLQTDEFKAHNHAAPGYDFYYGDSGGASGGGFYATNNYRHQFTNGGGGTETRPRNIAMMYCIRY